MKDTGTKNDKHDGKGTIGFKADAVTWRNFCDLVDSLELKNQSELARRAYLAGLPIAFEQMRLEALRKLEEDKKRAKVLKEMERAKGFEPSTFTLATWNPAMLCAAY